MPNSGSYELCYPQRETTIVGNLIYSNNQPDTPAIDDAILAMGNGILISGGVRNTISRNRVWDHDVAGIALAPFPEERALDDQPSPDEWDAPCADTKDDPVNTAPPESLLWDAYENVVTDNVIEDSRIADLAVGSIADPASLGNCFAGNTFATSAPIDLEALAPCDGDGEGDWTAGALDLGARIAAAEIVLHQASITRRPSFPSWKRWRTCPTRPRRRPRRRPTCPRRSTSTRSPCQTPRRSDRPAGGDRRRRCCRCVA